MRPVWGQLLSETIGDMNEDWRRGLLFHSYEAFGVELDLASLQQYPNGTFEGFLADAEDVTQLFGRGVVADAQVGTLAQHVVDQLHVPGQLCDPRAAQR